MRNPHTRLADGEGWSQSVRGLRMRLLVDRQQLRVGSLPGVVVELENTGADALLLRKPMVLPRLVGRAPADAVGNANMILFAMQDNGLHAPEDGILQAPVMLLEGSPIVLPPGEVFRLPVSLVPVGRPRIDVAMGAEEQRDPQPIHVYTPLGAVAGRYRFFARYMLPDGGRPAVLLVLPHPRPREWHGSLDSPGSEVVFREPKN